MSNVNDSLKDEAYAPHCYRGIRWRLNLIPLNEHAATDFKSPDSTENIFSVPCFSEFHCPGKIQQGKRYCSMRSAGGRHLSHPGGNCFAHPLQVSGGGGGFSPMTKGITGWCSAGLWGGRPREVDHQRVLPLPPLVLASLPLWLRCTG